MEVYVLSIYGGCEGDIILGVYTDQQLAQEAAVQYHSGNNMMTQFIINHVQCDKRADDDCADEADFDITPDMVSAYAAKANV